MYRRDQPASLHEKVANHQTNLYQQQNGVAGAAKLGDPLASTLLGARTLIEDDVYDASGKCLGEIEDIVLDTRTGCVRYAILALGGFLGIGCKRFAVPWSALTPDANYRRCVVNVAHMKIMAVPIFDDGRGSHANPRWDSNIQA